MGFDKIEFGVQRKNQVNKCWQNKGGFYGEWVSEVDEKRRLCHPDKFRKT